MKYLFWLHAQISRNDVHLPKDELNKNSIGNGLKLFFGIAGAIAVLTVVYGGVRYALSQGNPQETTKSKDIILNALIGLAIILSAFGIISLVTNFL
jgi:lysylphosphatidylglycerol synthetase-like protein (DUF2156 family)